MTDLRRGESARNTNRNNSRNSAALDNLTQGLIHQNATSFYYQYCHNSKCASVSVIMSARHLGVQNPHLDAIVKLGAKMRVPVLDIQHHPQDDTLKKPITITVWDADGNREVKENSSWRELAYLMQSYQLKHEENSSSWYCSSGYDKLWGKIGRGRSNQETDFSLSNMIRSIPGVRHLDIDSIIMCKECSEVEVMIEASSDGAKNTPFAEIHKATRMTRAVAKRASAYTLLVQHHVNDGRHEYPVQVTGWDNNNGDIYRPATTMPWSDLADELSLLHERHMTTAHTS